MENISPENNLDSRRKKYNNCYTQERTCQDIQFYGTRGSPVGE